MAQNKNLVLLKEKSGGRTSLAIISYCTRDSSPRIPARHVPAQSQGRPLQSYDFEALLLQPHWTTA
ncbi:MAG: hypothetical protein V4587_15230 [Acidobacteriota bacterium]